METKSLLIRLLIAITSLISASIYLWSATAYKYEDFYKHVSPLHVTTILFYFNVFLINIKIPNSNKLSKFINIIFIFCTIGFVVSGDLYSYFKEESHPEGKLTILYLLFAITELIYGIILVILNIKNCESRLMSNEQRLIRLLCLQFAYIITTLTQVIPLYMQKKIPLTNDFVYLFWLLYILDEKTSSKYISTTIETTPLQDNKAMSKSTRYRILNRIFATIFIIATVMSVYTFSVINFSSNDDDTYLASFRDITSFIANLCFYGWSLMSFYKNSVSANIDNYHYSSISST
ncbi:MAG: hypothetical protein Terrestrivirus2_216 [Terrestrivirus sp.]|uniref:Transmembrane protein n=1 Tax=Terrestrivirus sp. TaxID=2487775 RepID=A0A3G4ZLK4_9VIRU|nr:MAG: hypothetical protein Terrestrivirus2_216 [Terrestrivirus sp.]